MRNLARFLVGGTLYVTLLFSTALLSVHLMGPGMGPRAAVYLPIGGAFLVGGLIYLSARWW